MTTGPAGRRLGDDYDAHYAGEAERGIIRRIRKEVYGDDYPDEAQPDSFVTFTDLRRAARELQVGPGQTFVDLGCGRGGPGLWVARETGAALVGIDSAPTAVTHAARQAARSGLSDRTRYELGDIGATGLPVAAFDGALCLDTLLFVPDKPAALREVARILRPGARFVLTTWDFFAPSAAIPVPQVSDHRPLLQEAGFAVEVYEETHDWKRRQLAVYERTRALQDTIIAEMGEAAARPYITHAHTRAAELDRGRRIFVTARRT